MTAKFYPVLLGLILALLQASCALVGGAQQRTPEPGEGAVTRRPIEALNLTLELPDGLVEQTTPDGASGLTFCFKAERATRFMRCFSIQRVPSLPEAGVADWESELLAETGTFYFRTELRSGGSGGDIEDLEGYLVIDEHTFRVQAADQKEYPGKPDASWVIPIIRTARYVE